MWCSWFYCGLGRALLLLTTATYSRFAEQPVYSSLDLYVGPLSLGRLQHSQADTTHMLDTRLVPAVNAACDGSCTVVVEIVVKRAVASTEALILQEERVVEKCKGVEHVEIGLYGSAWNQYLR